jgi:hypothetical protein
MGYGLLSSLATQELASGMSLDRCLEWVLGNAISSL